MNIPTDVQKVFILNPSSTFRDSGKAAFQKRGISADIVEGYKTVLFLTENTATMQYEGSKIDFEHGYFLIRGKGNLVEDSFMLSLITELLHQYHVPFTTSSYRVHTSASGKLAQMIQFHAHGIPFPKSIICRKEGYIDNRDSILAQVQFPCVIKTLGANGEHVWKISSEDALEERIEEIANNKEPNNVFCIQEHIPNDSDIRVIVFEGEVIGAFKRMSSDGFLNNVARGGSSDNTTVSAEEIALAIKVCAVTNNDFAGVDIVRTEDGPKVFEVNRRPGFTGPRGFEAVTGIDIVDAIAAIVKKRYF